LTFPGNRSKPNTVWMLLRALGLMFLSVIVPPSISSCRDCEHETTACVTIQRGKTEPRCPTGESAEIVVQTTLDNKSTLVSVDSGPEITIGQDAFKCCYQITYEACGPPLVGIRNLVFHLVRDLGHGIQTKYAYGVIM
jgi:hypothetical protein